MYQSQSWRYTSRQLRQQQTTVKKNGKSTDSLASFLHFFSSRSHKTHAAVAMLGICFMGTLSGCGGLVYTGKTSLSGSSGAGTAATLAEVSCGTQSLSGPQTKACSVYLSASATSATVVSLKSSDARLIVPSAVTVSAGAQTTGFNAVSSNVTKTVSVTIAATSENVTKTTAITLYPATMPQTGLSLTKVSCGIQSLTGPTTKACSVYLSDTTTSPITVALSSSSNFLTVPSTVTVAAGNSTAGFGATALSVSTSQLATLTASYNGSSVTDAIQLIGSSGSTPTGQHVVKLSWNPPGTTVAGYRVYRSDAGISSFHLLNSAIDTVASYSDDTVVSGESYDYEVKSVSDTGVESAPSNTTTVTIPQ